MEHQSQFARFFESLSNLTAGRLSSPDYERRPLATWEVPAQITGNTNMSNLLLNNGFQVSWSLQVSNRFRGYGALAKNVERDTSLDAG